MSENLIQITESDLKKIEGKNALSLQQLASVTAKTPKAMIKSRPAKGGGEWYYVDAAYVQKVLNIMFGWDWDFEIIDEIIQHGEAVVKGKLTVRSNGRVITKMQYGNKEIVTRKNSDKALSIGNDLKAAASDALKKCAFAIGIAQDVYNPDSFKEYNIVSDDDMSTKIMELWTQNRSKLTDEMNENITRILENKETNNYTKTWNQLTKALNK